MASPVQCFYPLTAFWRLKFGRHYGPFLRHRYEETGTKKMTRARGLEIEKRCVRCGNTIWRKPR